MSNSQHSQFALMSQVKIQPSNFFAITNDHICRGATVNSGMRQEINSGGGASITKFADEFRVHPFAHRVEHSLHVRLVQLLSERDELRGWYPLEEGGFKSQLIHKEWPETYGEKLKDGTSKRRGSFDIAIVTPTSCARRASTSSGSAASLRLS